MLEKRILHIDGSFALEAGGVLENPHVAYHASARPYTPGEKVVWICHALTANSDPEDWWPQMVGPGKLLDPERYYIVCVNMLGSPYGSSCALDTDPATGKPYMLDFPKITVRDMARTLDAVRRALGIPQVDLLIGSSIGGFQAMEWSIMAPEAVKNLLLMATASRVPAFLTAYEESQRMALEADASFREAASPEGGKAGLEAARSIALISYRSFDGYERTQTDASPDTLFAARACSYQRYQGQKLSARFDAYTYWTLSFSVDSQNVGRGRGGVDKALSAIKARTVVAAIDTDALFPPKAMEKIAAAIPGASFHTFHSDFGHDGFLLETEAISKLINPLLQ